jgi:hypothetical protein
VHPTTNLPRRGSSRAADSPHEGKPAQTNALAALFFGRLYELTGDVVYRTWMLRSLLWLDTVLYDPGKRLYRWSVGYQDLAAKKGAVIHQRFFNYDQSIAIEAPLLAARLDGDMNRLPRAASVGEALQLAFWVPQYGYKLDADGAQIYVSYGAPGLASGTLRCTTPRMTSAG